MSANPSPLLKPLPLALGGILVIIAAVVFVTVSGNGSGTGNESSTESKLSSKSSSRHQDSSPGATHDGKSGGKTDEERYKHLSPEEFQELLVNLSDGAREEHKMLREKYATEFDDPEERKRFAMQIAQIKDPQERQDVLRQRTAEMNRARQKAEASKSPQDRAREKQLLVLMQLHNLNRMSAYVAENPELTEAARDFDTKLVQWVRDHEAMNQATFHQTFNKLKAEVTALRTRHAEQRKTEAKAAAGR